MSSAFAWLDYSEYEKRRALDVIALFRDQSTVDELGLGVIRDFLADRFFPGTSTIQTRARYFLFIPWIYLDLERKRVDSASASSRAKKQELDLIDVLAEEKEQGVIGIQARRTLKRLPSNVYWRGLSLWGVLLFPGSQPQYHRSLDKYYSFRPPPQADGDTAASQATRRNWHANLPSPPHDFPRKADLKLRRTEAEYLRERVIATHPESLLAHLLDREVLPETDFAWEEPAAKTWRHSEELEHARNFSEAMHGAALLYNLMLAEAVPPNSDWIDHYRSLLGEWTKTMREGSVRFSSWDRDAFWRLVSSARVRFPTKGFIDAWLSIAIGSDPASISEDKRARQLILDREVALKGGRARLTNAKARGLWNGESGVAQLDYRWRITKDIVTDLVRGFRSDA